MYDHTNLTLSPNAGFVLAPVLSPGNSQEIKIEVPKDCPAETCFLKVSLSAEFDGGSARVETTVTINVIEVTETEKDQDVNGLEGLDGSGEYGLHPVPSDFSPFTDNENNDNDEDNDEDKSDVEN